MLGRLFSRLDAGQLGGPPVEDQTTEAMAELARFEEVKKRPAELAGAGEIDLVDLPGSPSRERAQDERPTRSL